MLAPYAADPDTGRGREFPLLAGKLRGPRSEFQRDRDRIVHSMSFRRLRSKTQVFISPEGDHYRTRMTHSLEVAQIGRVIARSLGLNEDLTEALCLAHDIGHPPFGHAGEDALQSVMAEHGGFDHNAHTLRTIMRLESPYPEHFGLNLTWDSLEGLAKHNGPIEKPNWALSELDSAFSLELSEWPSLEAQVAAVADDIAYDNHDIDDGLRAGCLNLDDLLEIDLLRDQWKELEKTYPNATKHSLQRELIRNQIGLMVDDVIQHTKKQIIGLSSVDEVRGSNCQLSNFSPHFLEAERTLKKFMYDRLYFHKDQVLASEKANDIIKRLSFAYLEDSNLMPLEWQHKLPDEHTSRARVVADFIAGMSDRFAVERFTAIYGERPEGLSNV